MFRCQENVACVLRMLMKGRMYLQVYGCRIDWRRAPVSDAGSVSSWKLSLCVVYLFFACLVVSPDLGEIVSLSLLSRSVPQVSLVILTTLVVPE